MKEEEKKKRTKRFFINGKEATIKFNQGKYTFFKGTDMETEEKAEYYAKKHRTYYYPVKNEIGVHIGYGISYPDYKKRSEFEIAKQPGDEYRQEFTDFYKLPGTGCRY